MPKGFTVESDGDRILVQQCCPECKRMQATVSILARLVAGGNIRIGVDTVGEVDLVKEEDSGKNAVTTRQTK